MYAKTMPPVTVLGCNKLIIPVGMSMSVIEQRCTEIHQGFLYNIYLHHEPH